MGCSSCQQNNHVVPSTHVHNSTTQTHCECACGCDEPVCPTPQPCTEITDSKCIIYTDAPIKCEEDTVVTTNASVSTALNQIVTYFCENGGGGGTGPQGIQGVPGPTGPQGIAGSTGGAGTTGATGPQGIQGVPGPIGPAGLNWQGAWSALGVYAPDDAVGFGGASWFCLNAVGPSVSNPLSDPTNWALLASEGATGPAGPTGAAGVAGAAGATGPQGPAGSIGLTGAQGIQGPIGPAGTGNDVTLSSIGFGLTLVNDGVGPTLVTKSIQSGNGISMTASANEITISNSSGYFNYEIGQYVASEGGVIVHRWLSSTSYGVPLQSLIQNYIVMDLTDLGFTSWGLLAVNVANCESTWDGKTNTASMITAGAAVGTAAELCDVSANNGKTDWYLPAIDELSMIWQNRFLINLHTGVTAGFTPLLLQNYWSSLETDANNSYHFTFINGASASSGKNLNYFVRAVRRFSI